MWAGTVFESPWFSKVTKQWLVYIRAHQQFKQTRKWWQNHNFMDQQDGLVGKKCLRLKLDELSSIPGSHMVERKSQFPSCPLTSTHAHRICTSQQKSINQSTNHNFNIKKQPSSKVGKSELERRLSRKRHLPPQLMMGVGFPEPVWLKERTDYPKLSSDLLMCITAHVPPQINEWMNNLLKEGKELEETQMNSKHTRARYHVMRGFGNAEQNDKVATSHSLYCPWE